MATNAVNVVMTIIAVRSTVTHTQCHCQCRRRISSLVLVRVLSSSSRYQSYLALEIYIPVQVSTLNKTLKLPYYTGAKSSTVAEQPSVM